MRYKSFRYQAESWSQARRIVAKVEHHQGELFPRVGFIVTSMSLPSRSVVRFYNKRGTAEQWIKKGKQATHWTRLSCHRFRANQVRLQLSVPAYNLGKPLARLLRCATALRVTAPAKKLGARAAQRLDALRAAIVRADEARAQGLQGGLQAKIADMDTQQSTSVHWAARRAEKGTSSFVLRAAPTRLQQPR